MWDLSAGMKHGVSVFNVLTAAFCRKRDYCSRIENPVKFALLRRGIAKSECALS